MGNTKRRRRRGLDRRLLILLSITPVGCLFALLLGLALTWYLFPTRFVNAEISELPPEEAQQIVIMAAADFAEHQDLERANEFLAQLKVPNPPQYVSLVAEQLIRTNRGPVDPEIEAVVRLADALNVSTVSMIAYVSTPTPLPTDTPIPTPTATSTPVIPTSVPTEVPTALPEVAAQPVNAETEAVAEEVAVVAEVAPMDTPVPEVVPPTNTPAPPPLTDTPVPEPTPVPEFDFIITKQRLLTKDENGGCAGNHNIFVDVVDASGNPIKGVQLGDTWNNPGPVTGHKGDDKPGRAEYDLYKDGGYHVLVKSDPTAGREVTSQVTELLSSDDWKIGIPRLIEAGYCPDEATCRVLWNSGVFGEGNNSLCWGHYSWEVTFQRTW